jgi:parallel beta-helix repeat protein
VAHAGSSATFRNNTVTGLGQTLGSQYPLQIGIAVESQGTATISGNTVSRNVQAPTSVSAIGIYLTSAGPGVKVSHNKVTGNNLGIELLSSSGVSVAHNRVTGSTLNGISIFSSADDTVTGNRVESNGVEGILVVSTTGATLKSNTVSGNGGNGISLFSVTGATVQSNQARDNTNDGIFADAASTGDLFSRNTLSGNKRYDAEDLSTGTGIAGTANTWSGNKGKTDNKGGGLLV